MKKQSGLFDVTMRAYDGAEVCELLGTYYYLLYQKSKTKKISNCIAMKD